MYHSKKATYTVLHASKLKCQNIVSPLWCCAVFLMLFYYVHMRFIQSYWSSASFT